MFLRRFYAFGLLETLLALVVAATLIILSVNYFQTVHEEGQVNTVVLQMKNIRDSLDALAETNQGKLSNQALEQFLDPQDIRNPWTKATYNLSLLPSSQITALGLDCNLAYSVTLTLPDGSEAANRLTVLTNKLNTTFEPQPGIMGGNAKRFKLQSNRNTNLVLNFCF